MRSPLPPREPRGFARRALLSLPLLAAGGSPLLAGCSSKESEPPIVPATVDPTAGQPPGINGVDVEVLASGQTLQTTVGPLVRASYAGSDLSILPIHGVRSDDGSQAPMGATGILLGGLAATVGVYKPLRLISPDGARLWSTTTIQGFAEGIEPGAELDLYPTFGPVDTDTVTVFVSHGGFVEVPVVESSDPGAPRLDVGTIVSRAGDGASVRDAVALEQFVTPDDGAEPGPTAAGPDGVTVHGTLGAGEIVVRLAQVERRNGLLLGVLEVTGGGRGGTLGSLGTGWMSDPSSVLGNARGETSGVTNLFAADGLSLLSGSQRYHPLDYLLPETDAHRSLTELELTESLERDVTSRVCVAWPDTGESTVVVDHPGSGATSFPWRLTDVPVS